MVINNIRLRAVLIASLLFMSILCLAVSAGSSSIGREDSVFSFSGDMYSVDGMIRYMDNNKVAELIHIKMAAGYTNADLQASPVASRIAYESWGNIQASDMPFLKRCLTEENIKQAISSADKDSKLTHIVITDDIAEVAEKPYPVDDISPEFVISAVNNINGDVITVTLENETYLNSTDSRKYLESRILQYCVMNNLRDFLYAFNKAELDANLAGKINSGKTITIASSESDKNSEAKGNYLYDLWWTPHALYGATDTSIAVIPYGSDLLDTSEKCQPEVEHIRQYAARYGITLDRQDDTLADELKFHGKFAGQVISPLDIIHLYYVQKDLNNAQKGMHTNCVLGMYYRAKEANINLNEPDGLWGTVADEEYIQKMNLSHQEKMWLSEILAKTYLA